MVDQPEESDLRRRAAWLLAMLAVVAVLFVVLLTVVLDSSGGGKNNNNGVGPDDTLAPPRTASSKGVALAPPAPARGPVERHARPAVRRRATARPRTPARCRATRQRDQRGQPLPRQNGQKRCPARSRRRRRRARSATAPTASAAGPRARSPSLDGGKAVDKISEAGQAARPADEVLRGRLGLLARARSSTSSPSSATLSRRPAGRCAVPAIAGAGCAPIGSRSSTSS